MGRHGRPPPPAPPLGHEGGELDAWEGRCSSRVSSQARSELKEICTIINRGTPPSCNGGGAGGGGCSRPRDSLLATRHLNPSLVRGLPGGEARRRGVRHRAGAAG